VNVDMRPRWRSGVAAVLAGAAAVLLLAAPSSAREAGKTYTITTVRTRGSVWVAAAPEGMKVGRLSPGDRLIETNDILRDGHVKGLFIGTAMVASPRPVAAKHAVGMIRGIYRFADGDLYVDGVVSFGTTAGSGVIVGGTGAYEGARGSLQSDGSKEKLRLVP
jgi:hypothetical protein